MYFELQALTRSQANGHGDAGPNGSVVLIPIGAIEQHGEHLPIGTDTILAKEVALRAAVGCERPVVVAPPIWTGFSPHHMPFGATVTVSATTLLALLHDVTESLRSWMSGPIWFVNGHGGNRGLLATFCLGRANVRFVNYWELASAAEASECFPDDLGSIGHAGQAETSMMAALGESGIPAEANFVSVVAGDPLYSPDLGKTGAIGDATKASVPAGDRFLTLCAARLSDLISAT